MMDREPTQPHRRADRAGGVPTWPPQLQLPQLPQLPQRWPQLPLQPPRWPRPRPPRTEGLPTWGLVLLFVVVALVSFGVVWGVGSVLVHHNNSITVPSPPSPPSPPSRPANGSGVLFLPTDTAQPKETAQPDARLRR
jgi:hypothetical protein